MEPDHRMGILADFLHTQNWTESFLSGHFHTYSSALPDCSLQWRCWLGNSRPKTPLVAGWADWLQTGQGQAPGLSSQLQLVDRFSWTLAFRSGTSYSGVEAPSPLVLIDSQRYGVTSQQNGHLSFCKKGATSLDCALPKKNIPPSCILCSFTPNPVPVLMYYIRGISTVDCDVSNCRWYCIFGLFIYLFDILILIAFSLRVFLPWAISWTEMSLKWKLYISNERNRCIYGAREAFLTYASHSLKLSSCFWFCLCNVIGS